jgi:cell division protein FtsB
VYYSKVFAPFAEKVDKLKNSQPSLLTGFETNYKVWIGYHAILQQQQAASLDEDAVPGQSDTAAAMLEQYRERERERIAKVQVKQALEIAKLQLQLTKEGASQE